MGGVASAIGGVLGAVGAVFSVFNFREESRGIQRSVDLERQKVALLAEQRRMERERREAALKKEARIRRGALANAAAAAGVLRSTSFTAGFQGISSFLSGQLEFSQQAAELARRADKITQASIGIDASQALNRARADLFSGFTQGIGAAATGFQGASDAGLFD